MLLCYSVNAQIKIKCDIETGYLNDKYSLNLVDTYPLDGFEVQYNSGHVLYCDVIADFSIKKFHVEQQIYNVFSYEDYSFSPLEIVYKTRIYYKHKSFSCGYEHMCLHPVINQHNQISVVTRRGSYDKVFVRFTFEN